MNFNEYQKLAQRTAKTKDPKDKIINGLMGLNGEAGEAIDVLKKHMFQGHPLKDHEVLDEVSDVLWYCAEIATGLGVPLEDIAKHNIEKLKKRFPEGFSVEKSIHRGEY